MAGHGWSEKRTVHEVAPCRLPVSELAVRVLSVPRAEWRLAGEGGGAGEIGGPSGSPRRPVERYVSSTNSWLVNHVQTIHDLWIRYREPCMGKTGCIMREKEEREGRKEIRVSV